ncbi:MAG TPA: HAMP domain-containing sensor histidine kinase [Albitalea sp.]|nr:HAMP domain-containing sensor histidine kinase [Albitalea sp.]
MVRAAVESERPTPDSEAILGTLAHDLRNPLAPLRTAVELLSRPAVGEESRQRARAIMSRQITEMARLIDEMSEFSRLGSGKVALQRSTLDLGDVVRAALDQARAAIDEKQLVLSVELPPDPCVLNADRARLVQALSMLLGDAARRSERGRRLWVRAVSADEGVAIGLRDEELGLSGDSPAAPFTLLPLPGRPLVGDARGAARFQSRIGLGFMLAQRLVELHGGWLQSRSDVPGEGREVVLVLPGQVPAR